MYVRTCVRLHVVCSWFFQQYLETYNVCWTNGLGVECRIQEQSMFNPWLGFLRCLAKIILYSYNPLSA